MFISTVVSKRRAVLSTSSHHYDPQTQTYDSTVPLGNQIQNITMIFLMCN